MKFSLAAPLIFLQILCWSFFVNGQNTLVPTNEDLKILIEPTPNDGWLTVTGRVENLTDYQFELKYRLTVIQKVKNYSRNRQTNKVILKGNESKQVGKVEVRYAPESIFEIQLEIFHDTTLISFMEISNELDKGIEGTGLLIDETRTKNGSDFYGLFNKHWTTAEIKTDAMVKIEEKPGRSRSTQISVFVNESLIFRRNLFSRYSQIEEQAEWAFQVTQNYLKRNPRVNRTMNTEDLLGNGLN